MLSTLNTNAFATTFVATASGPSSDPEFKEITSPKNFNFGSKEFLSELAYYTNELSLHDLMEVLKYMLRYDLKATVEFAGRSGATTWESLELLLSSEAEKFHPAFTEELNRVLHKVESNLTAESKKTIEEVRSYEIQKYEVSEDSYRILGWLDKHFEAVYEKRSFEKFDKSKLDPAVSNFLKEKLRAHLPHYYTGPIVSKIMQLLGTSDREVVRESLDSKAPDIDLLSESSIYIEDVKKLARSYEFDSDEFTTKRNRHSPIGLIHHQRRDLAAVSLKGELLRSLARIGGDALGSLEFANDGWPMIAGERLKQQTDVVTHSSEINRTTLSFPREKESYAANESGYIFSYYDSKKGLYHLECSGRDPLEIKADEVNCCRSVGGELYFKKILDNKASVIWNGKEGAPYDKIETGASSVVEIGGELAYQARRGSEWFVVIGDKEAGPYDAVGSLITIDGKLTYIAGRGSKWFVIIGDKEAGPYDEVGSLITIDGKLAYSAKRGSKSFIVIGDKEAGANDHFDSLTNIDGRLIYRARKGGKWFVVIDGKEGEPYDFLGSLTNIDGKLAYSAKRGYEWFIVIDGKEEGPCDKVKILQLRDKPVIILTKNTLDGNVEVTFIRKLVTIITAPSLSEQEYDLCRLLKLTQSSKLSESELGNLEALCKEEPKNVTFGGKALALAKKFGLVKTDKNHGRLNASNMLENLFPELAELKRNRLRDAGGAVTNSTAPHSSRTNRTIDSGNPLEAASSNPYLSTEYTGFLVSGLFGKYDPKNNSWSHLNIPLTPESTGTVTEYSFRVLTAPKSNLLLQVPINGEFDSNSIEGATLKSAGFNPEVQSTGDQVTYRARVGSEFSLGSNPTWRSYNRIFNSEAFIKDGLRDDLAPSSKELDQIAISLHRDTPLKTAAAIQAYVRDNFYYDMLASETANRNNSLSPATRVDQMKLRLNFLLESCVTDIGNKKYAGICGDAMLLTTILLRKAGLAAGVATGHTVGSHGHGCSYVLMPTKESSGSMVVPVDGTPSRNESSSDLGLPVLSALLEQQYGDAETEEVAMRLQDLPLKALAEALSQLQADSGQRHGSRTHLNASILFGSYYDDQKKTKLLWVLNYILYTGREEIHYQELVGVYNERALPTEEIDREIHNTLGFAPRLAKIKAAITLLKQAENEDPEMRLGLEALVGLYEAGIR
jgi:hypothetical protein